GTTALATSSVTNSATRMNAGPYGAVVVVQIGLTLSSSEFGLSIGPTMYGSNPSRSSAPCAKYEYVSRLNTGTDSSRGASQNPVVATIVYSVAVRSITRRPSHSQAMSITATPTHSSTDDNTRPWPNRSQDRCSDSSRGSCRRVLPAPSPPVVINTAPSAPSSAGCACGDFANDVNCQR